MSIRTFSSFYYGHQVTADNNLIDFNEGGSDLIAEIEVGTYTLTDFLTAVQNAINDAGSQTYTISVDRTTRLVTIAASSNFSLLVSSGVSTGTSGFSLLGFTGTDRTGTNTYAGNIPSGSEYRPQFILQDHIPKENFKRTVQASVNESASGEVEVIRFGNVRFTQFNIKFITDKPMDQKLIRNNPTGVDDANDFMNYITQVVPIEYIPDVSDRNTFDKVQLDSTEQSKDGIDYTLKELLAQNLPGLYETGKLVFRVLS